ncbi:PTS sugar transporter subunit IIA [Clostridium beijerinckii]|uniref:PTS system fructose-specific EIIABC component n=1 Tax=Clostridium beijerinckii TaxID=1520 RepID=A0A1S8RP58_CLOBE|nr:PTS sugar transporter subunit IIA [Clostridium beijerinckii]NRY60119.1 PTS system fructose-specific IIA component [Clostridium beijerinckii]OOM55017.1 PTS system fructose-specific EIIABC component [Clostridium beijerinckii]
MNLLDVISLETINIDLQAQTKQEVIVELSKLLHKENRISSVDEFVKAVYEREAIGETGMGNHVAIPHGHTDAVLHASVAVGKVNTPIEWESLDDQPVNLIFLIAAPKNNKEISHLSMLSQLASVLSYEEIQNELMECENKNEFLKIFTKYFDEYSKNRE